jgi:hypothetical protein
MDNHGTSPPNLEKQKNEKVICLLIIKYKTYTQKEKHPLSFSLSLKFREKGGAALGRERHVTRTCQRLGPVTVPNDLDWQSKVTSLAVIPLPRVHLPLVCRQLSMELVAVSHHCAHDQTRGGIH